APSSLFKNHIEWLLLLWLWACGPRSCVVHHVHSVLCERTGRALAPHRHGRAVAERLMRAPTMVEGDPIADAGLGLATVSVPREINVVVLEPAPQSLTEHDVHPGSTTGHADLSPRAGQEIREYLVAGRRLRGSRLWSERGDAHLAHQPLHALAVHALPVHRQHRRHAP